MQVIINIKSKNDIKLKYNNYISNDENNLLDILIYDNDINVLRGKIIFLLAKIILTSDTNCEDLNIIKLQIYEALNHVSNCDNFDFNLNYLTITTLKESKSK